MRSKIDHSFNGKFLSHDILIQCQCLCDANHLLSLDLNDLLLIINTDQSFRSSEAETEKKVQDRFSTSPKNCNEMTLLHKMYPKDIQIQVWQKYLPVWWKIDPSRIPSFSSFQSLALLKVQGSFQKFLFWKHLWITSACTWVELLGFVFLLGWALISPLQNLILPLLTLHWGNFVTCSDFLFQAPPKPRSSWYIIIIKITLILIISSNLGWQTPCLGQNESTLAFSSQVTTWKTSNVIAYNREIKSTLKSWKEQLRW